MKEQVFKRPKIYCINPGYCDNQTRAGKCRRKEPCDYKRQGSGQAISHMKRSTWTVHHWQKVMNEV